MFKRSKTGKKSFRLHAAIFGLGLLASSFGAVAMNPMPAFAQDDKDKDQHFCQVVNGKIVVDPDKPCIAKDISVCDPKDPNKPCGDPAVSATCKTLSCNKIITDYVDPFVKLLTGLVGIVVAISIVWAGVQYSSASGDSSKVVAAKSRLTNAILALLAYLFLFSFLNWIMPGGLL